MNTMTDTPSKSSAPVFQPGTSDAEIEAAKPANDPFDHPASRAHLFLGGFHQAT